ncbi:MAG: hypothetical protein ABIM22_07205 [candidate division WOR-3 bacterium]
MKVASKLLYLGLCLGSLLVFSCRKPEDYEDEAVVSLCEISETQDDANSSEAQVQLAQLPEPDGIPILVGIDKAPFWVKDPSDPTPFIHMVNLYTNIYVRSRYDFGEYLFTDSQWVRVGEFYGVSLKWEVGSDTLNLILTINKYQEDDQGRLYVTSGRLNLIKNSADTLYGSIFEIQDSILDLSYGLKGIMNANVVAVKSQKFVPFVGVINGTIVNSLGKTTTVVSEVKSDDTRHVVIDFTRFNIDFRIVADVSAKRITSLPAFREITGDFYANGKDIGDVSGVKYEFDTSEHKSYLNITLSSGKVIRLWN